jgi:hypothetical protein
MNSWPCLILAAALITSSLAQELTTQESSNASTATKNKTADIKGKKEADALIARKPIIYGGFATDLSKSTNAPKLLSLRQPNNPKADQENVHFDEKTGRAKGFVLLRLSF